MSYAAAPIEAGAQFGKLIVTEWVGQRCRIVPVRCECGTETTTTRVALRAAARSCGCDRTFCECGKATIRRSGRQLLTCGATECAARMRGRNIGVSLRGRRGGGGAARVEDPGYTGMHARARRALRGRGCALVNASCSGRLEAALRVDAAPEHLRTDAAGRLYSIDPDTLAAYRQLCRSHHAREGRTWALVREHPEVARALAVERLRVEHAICDGCPLCAALTDYDKAVVAMGLGDQG